MCICLWKRGPRLFDGGVCPRRGAEGERGQGGAQVIEVSPPLTIFFFFYRGLLTPSSFHPLRPIHTAGTITAPHHPQQLAPREPTLITKRNSVGLFPLNLSAPATGGMAKLHAKPEGEEEKNEKNSGSSATFNTLSKKKKKGEKKVDFYLVL